jgi:hypothetical protein
MDITQLILDDHHEQRRLFSILDQIADDDVKSLDAVWARLATFLEVHAKAEEELFYPALLRVGEGAGGKSSAASETIDAIKDHNEIRDAVAKAPKHKTGTADWRKAVAEANKANGDHMAEEEREGLTDFRRQAPLKLRHDLAVGFARFEAEHIMGVAPVDQDPKTYVAEHK